MHDAKTSNSSIRGNSVKRRIMPITKLGKAIKQTRGALTSESGHSIEFDKAILTIHAENFLRISPLIVAMIIFMGLASLAWLNYFGVIAWVVVSLSAQMLIIHVTKRFLKKEALSDEKITAWNRSLICCSLLSGIIWSTFLLIPVTTPSLSQPVFMFTTLLLVAAIYCFISAHISLALLCDILPITMVLTLSFGLSGYTSMIMMAGLFIIAQILFILMARHIKENFIQVFNIRDEKDNLIVDLEEATLESNESARRAEEANIAKSRFLATMSHELRTPLNAIIGFSEIMKSELLGPLKNDSYKEYVVDIHSSGDHLLNLINEILDLSRIEAERYDLNEEAVCLVEVVEDCKTLIEIRAKNKKIQINFLFENKMPKVWADQRAIRQVVLNLLSNAVKFTPQNGTITIYAGWTSGGGQYVSVEDTGPGIPEDEIPTVMEQFGQGSSAIKNAEQGTGLGLPISQALINIHGGTFNLKSKLRVGTTVTVSLPRIRVMEALAPIKKPAQGLESNQQNLRLSA
ncbi:MAG: HAMP domain-containing sensor histidine kinase [Hyphomicrobiales bacterium]